MFSFFKKTSNCITKDSDHDFTNWERIRALINDYGNIIVYQTRTCKKCGYVQIDKQEK